MVNARGATGGRIAIRPYNLPGMRRTPRVRMPGAWRRYVAPMKGPRAFVGAYRHTPVFAAAVSTGRRTPANASERQAAHDRRAYSDTPLPPIRTTHFNQTGLYR